MLLFELDCGRSVYLDSLRYSPTYTGNLIGKPNKKRNDRITARACTNTIGPAHLVIPTVDETDPDRPMLPPVEMVAEIWCNDPIGDGMGSHAAIVWYRDIWDNQSLVDVVLDGIRRIDWDSVAADFDW